MAITNPVQSRYEGALSWLRSREVIVASQRGPVEHYLDEAGQLAARRGSGGLMSALEALAAQLPFTWVAAAMTRGDRLAVERGMPLDGQATAARLHYVALADAVHQAHYGVFSNRFLWFFEHGLIDQASTRFTTGELWDAWTAGYQPANTAIAGAVALGATTADPVVFVHDYQLHLAPRAIRARLPRATILHFSHIPWPDPNVWETAPAPMRREILRGMMGADIVGFQDDRSAQRFLRTCRAYGPDGLVDVMGRRIRLADREIHVRTYPISVDPAALRAALATPEVRAYRGALESRRDEAMIVRVDRVDPIKNIPLGFQAYGQLLERRPDLVGRVRFLAFLVPSRSDIAEYRGEYEASMAAVAEVNRRFGRDGYEPVEVFYENNRQQALAGMSLADVLLVNSVADGMNLVAKEGPIVSERDAALVLSTEAGAWSQLRGAALGIDPHSLDQTVAALETAVDMPSRERRSRATELRRRIEAHDIWDWLDEQCEDLASVADSEAPSASRILSPA